MMNRRAVTRSIFRLLLIVGLAWIGGCGTGDPVESDNEQDVSGGGADTGTLADTAIAEDSGAQDTGAAAIDTGAAPVDTAAGKDSGATDIGPKDAKQPGECPGGAGCTCTGNADCDAGFCVQLADKKVCASKCVDACGQGFACKTVSAGADGANYCVPTWDWLCDPCTKTEQCKHLGIEGAVCVSHGNDGGFCGAPCDDDAGCPAQHACQAVASVEGATSKQCVPKGDSGAIGACGCSAAAKKKKLATTCAIVSKNDNGEVVGKCPGTRTCEATGLTPCIGPPPSAEKCDGIDNNCNGKTDEGTCDDTKACTADACDPSKAKDGKEGCVHNLLQGPCDADGTVCTESDACKDGICVPGPAKNCDDGNPCTIDACDAAAGCTVTNDDGKACDADGNPCTAGDACNAGKCEPGAPKKCLSGDACIDAKCDPLSGQCKLKAKPEGAPCDDNSSCTTTDGCKGGSCAGVIINCDDGNACTIDACKADKGCVSQQSTSPCSDGSACTVGDVCKAGVCFAGAKKACEDGNPCTATNCDAASGKCLFSKLTSACDDGSACTVQDSCNADALCTGKAKACDDSNPCTDSSCDPKSGCVHKANQAPCDDGNICTTASGCQGGKCVGLANKASATCDDGNPCTDDGCDPTAGGSGPDAGCVHKARLGGCSDDNPCTTGDDCKAGKCVPGPNTCECQSHADCAKKDDGDLCNGTLLCDKSGAAPKCVLNKATIVTCQTVNDTACSKNTCVPQTGKCAMKAQQDGLDCSDGTVCTVGDSCAGGKCVPGSKVVCNDNNPCTDDACHPLNGCVQVANSAPCDDGKVCTQGDTCANKQCAAGKNVCECEKDVNCALKEDGDACNGTLVCDTSKAPYKCVIDKTTIVSCDPTKDDACRKSTCAKESGKCALQDVNVGGSCDDGDACTTGDLCGKGTSGVHGCVPGKAKSCDDGNDCTLDSCDKAKGCVNKGDTEKKLPCYSGKDGTKDVGECKGGLRTCQADGSAGKCEGEVVPNAQEACDGKDDTCDGKTDTNCAAVQIRLKQTSMHMQSSGANTGLWARSGSAVSGPATGAGNTAARWGWLASLRSWWAKK